MKDVFCNADSARVGLFKSVLDAAGIGCFIRNENVSPAAVPIPVFYPTLCVVDDADFDRAATILAEYQQTASAPGGEWTCPNCQAKVPAGFETCWKCEHDRPRA